MNPLSKIDSALAQQAADAAILGSERGPLQPGVRFDIASDASWHDGSGYQHEHRLRLLCEVTAYTARGIESRVLEVISEEDAPPPGIRRVPERISIAAFAIPPAIESGHIVVLGANPEVQP